MTLGVSPNKKAPWTPNGFLGAFLLPIDHVPNVIIDIFL